MLTTVLPTLLPLSWTQHHLFDASGHHHELGVHASNYSDFPLWDILMGTFKNPKSFDGDVGFAGEAPRRVGAMLAFQDVNRN